MSKFVLILEFEGLSKVP